MAYLDTADEGTEWRIRVDVDLRIRRLVCKVMPPLRNDTAVQCPLRHDTRPQELQSIAREDGCRPQRVVRPCRCIVVECSITEELELGVI